MASQNYRYVFDCPYFIFTRCSSLGRVLVMAWLVAVAITLVALLSGDQEISISGRRLQLDELQRAELIANRNRQSRRQADTSKQQREQAANYSLYAYHSLSSSRGPSIDYVAYETGDADDPYKKLVEDNVTRNALLQSGVFKPMVRFYNIL